MNAVHLAARNSSRTVMTSLLQQFSSLVDSKDAALWTPLGFLCNKRFDLEAVEVARVLLDFGASVDELCGPGMFFTPFFFPFHLLQIMTHLFFLLAMRIVLSLFLYL